MPEPTSFEFSHKEVVTALLKERGINTGLWGIHVRFGLKAMNLGTNDEDLLPTALIPVIAIGIKREEKPNNLSVNAAEVNPATPTPRRVGAGKTVGVRKKA